MSTDDLKAMLDANLAEMAVKGATSVTDRERQLEEYAKHLECELAEQRRQIESLLRTADPWSPLGGFRVAIVKIIGSNLTFPPAY